MKISGKMADERTVLSSPSSETLKSKLGKIWNTHAFLILVLLAIILARAYPPLGAKYLAPQITATYLAVMFIFLLAGISLKTEEFAHAFQNVKFNLFVQLFSFLVDSSVCYGLSVLLVDIGVLPQSLGDGLVIASCLPITINMVFVLTKSAHGDEAAAVFHAAIGNMIGVFLTPPLVLMYTGSRGDVDIVTVFWKLGVRVLLPILIGQLIQKFYKPGVIFVKEYKSTLKKIQERLLVFIVYTVFCKTFNSNAEVEATECLIMVVVLVLILCLLMALAWWSLGVLFNKKPRLRVMGLFGCTHKTVAMGIPLITAIYENNPNLGLYTLPLLVWHPMQLVIGSALVPRLIQFVETKENQLNSVDDDSNDVNVDGAKANGVSEGGQDNV